MEFLFLFCIGAILTGGPLGRLAGKIGDIVFGAARTRIGKAVTAREKVSPSNPRTVAQVLQRNIFSEALYAVRHLTASMWQTDWNRSIGQLPGFQSMMSIILDNTDASEDFIAPAVTPLGNLHFPDTFAFVTGVGSAGDVDVSWSIELGLNGTANDEFQFALIQVAAEADQTRPALFIQADQGRSIGLATINSEWDGVDFIAVGWANGLGTAEGLITPAFWEAVTTKA